MKKRNKTTWRNILSQMLGLLLITYILTNLVVFFCGLAFEVGRLSSHPCSALFDTRASYLIPATEFGCPVVKWLMNKPVKFEKSRLENILALDGRSDTIITSKNDAVRQRQTTYQMESLAVIFEKTVAQYGYSVDDFIFYYQICDTSYVYGHEQTIIFHVKER
jgi:hypothetical protein